MFYPLHSEDEGITSYRTEYQTVSELKCRCRLGKSRNSEEYDYINKQYWEIEVQITLCSDYGISSRWKLHSL
jgi:hypothetical protein